MPIAPKHARFWSHVNKDGPIHPVLGTNCWTWKNIHRNGRHGRYGRFYIGGKGVGAHRYAYTMFVGKVPEGLLVCHKCDNGLCVRPDHLFVGTNSDNMSDMKRKGRSRKSPETIIKLSIAHLGIQPSKATRKKMGEAQKGRLAGEKHHMHKLTEELVRYIRSVPYVAGKAGRGNHGSDHLLAKELGVSKWAVTWARTGRQWSCVK